MGDEKIGNNFVDVDFKELSKEINGEPLFYTTSQVAEILDEPVSTVRFWAKRFNKLLDVEISNKDKHYKKTDVIKLKFIKKLARNDNLTLQQIEEYCSKKGFDENEIKKAVVDGSNPLAVQVFTTAVMSEVQKQLNDFKEGIVEEVKKSLNESLNFQKEFNDKLYQDIVTTVDEVVCDKLEQHFSNDDNKKTEFIKEQEERDIKLVNNLKELLEVQKQDKEHKNLFYRLFKHKK